MPRISRFLITATLGATLISGAARATVTPPVRVLWGPEVPATVVAGQPFLAHVVIEATAPGTVEGLAVDGDGWSAGPLGVPSAFSMARGERRDVTFLATPSNVMKPLRVTFLFDGQPVTRSFPLDPVTLARRGKPGSLIFAHGAPRLIGSRNRSGPSRSGTLAAQSIRFTGRVAYARGDGDTLGADNLAFSIMDQDSPTADETIYSGVTDTDGNFDVTVDWSDCDITGCDDPDIYIRLEATNASVQVIHLLPILSEYVWTTENNVIQDFTGSEVDFGLLMPAGGEDGAVHVLNAITRAYHYLQPWDGTTLPLIAVEWPSTDSSTAYTPGGTIKIQSSETWNEGSIVHEYGHYYEYVAGNTWTSNYCNGFCDGGMNCPSPGHCVWCPEDSIIGWHEGFADWFGSVVVRHIETDYGPTVTAAINDNRYMPDDFFNCGADGLLHTADADSTEGFTFALLRDMDDADLSAGDIASACDRDAMQVPPENILSIVRLDDPNSAVRFISAYRARYPEDDQDLWSTARRQSPVFSFPLPAPVIDGEPPACTVLREGEYLQLSVSSHGSLLQYSWRQDGYIIGSGGAVHGAQSPTLTIFPVTQANAGVYTCVVYTCDNSLSATSTPAQVTVEPGVNPTRVAVWGANDYGQAGIGTISTPILPTMQQTLDKVAAADAGYLHTLYLLSDGTVYASGSNTQYQLGDSTVNTRPAPVRCQDPGLFDIVEVAAGAFHSLALRRNGTVWSWGYNNDGECGDGANYTTTPALRQVALPWCAAGIASGDYWSAALEADGTVWAWGNNPQGQLGQGVTGGRSNSPLQVAGLSSIVSIAAGTNHFLALRSDGTVWAWGYNLYGQLGDSTTSDRSMPVQVHGLTGVASIGAGENNSYAVMEDGTAWAWGDDSFGNCGDGVATAHRLVPVQVSGLTDVRKVVGGWQWAIALLGDGTLRAWGYNGYQTLGTAAPSYSLLPVPVPNAILVKDVTADRQTAYALGYIGGASGVAATEAAPARTMLLPGAPNPFRESTTISFELSRSDRAALRVFDISGRLVRTLSEGPRPAGRYSVRWDGRNDAGGAVASGVYFARLAANGVTSTQRIVLFR